MYIIDVIPIAGFFGEETLSYFHTSDIASGSLVKIPIGKREVTGMVVGSRNAKEYKQELRNQDFSIKKVSQLITDTPTFNIDFLKAAKMTALHHASPFGLVLKTLIPKKLLESASLMKVKYNGNGANEFKTVLYEGSHEQRTEYYSQEIKKMLDRKRDILVICPTNLRASQLAIELGNDFDNLNLLKSTDSKKKYQKVISGMTDSSNILVGTPMILPFTQNSHGLLIVDNYESGAYKSIQRPCLDLRFTIHKLAELMNTNLILADTYLGTEIKQKAKKENLHFEKDKKRGLEIAEIIDMREDKEEDKINPFPFVSNRLKRVVENIKSLDKIFIYAPRRGMAGITTCNDCGQSVVCHNCYSPVVLHKGNKTNNFVCHACGSQRSAHETCTNCGGWNLKALGLGIEALESDIREINSEINIFTISQDSTTTDKQAKDIYEQFNSEGGILLGTQKSLPHLSQISTSVIASLDAILANPSYRTREEAMRTILYLSERTTKEILIQTRDPENEFVTFLENNNVEDLYEKELSDRKSFGYPPFKQLIKIEIPKIDEGLISKLQSELISYNSKTYDSLSSRTSSQINKIFLLQLNNDDWPNKNLDRLLSSLPPNVKVKINPSNMF